MGRFLTRDTWEGNTNAPLTLNRWNYTISNPINFTDPTGNWPCDLEIGGKCIFIPGWRLPSADYVPESIEWGPPTSCGCSVWNLANWQLYNEESWSNWLSSLNAYSVFCHTMPGSNSLVTWYDDQENISQEELIAILVSKEVNYRLGNIEAKNAYKEAIGRTYWNYCGPDGCRIKNNIADSRLISFLNYYESWRKLSGGIKDILQGGDLVQRFVSDARIVAQEIIAGGPGGSWKSGKEDNKPYDIGYITKGVQPPWLANYLSLGPTGTQWNEVVFADSSDLVITDFVLTPAQKRNLCFNTSCFYITNAYKTPNYVKSYLDSYQP